jgi:hypothetical protein
MWAPNQCTDPWKGPVPPSLTKLPSPSQDSLSPLPHAKWLPWACPLPISHLDFAPTPFGFKAQGGCWESSWGQLPLPGSHLGVNGGMLCLAKWGPQVQHPHLLTPLARPYQFVLRRVFLLIKLKGHFGLMVLALGGAGQANAWQGDPG